MIIDVHGIKNYRLINIYRTFTPPLNITLKENFIRQMTLINTAITTFGEGSSIILGDLNLDDSKRNDPNYRNKSFFEIMSPIIDQNNLMQIITFPTWQRVVNNH